MDHFDTKEIRYEEGVYIKYHDGYFTFRLSFDELIAFEEVNTEIFEEYDLKNGNYIGATFNIAYEEIYRDIDDDDYVIFRLLKLDLVE